MRLGFSVGLVVAAACLADAQDEHIDAPAAAAPEVEAPVTAAIDWLARHQDADGLWHTASFPSRCEGVKCTGVGAADGDVGATAVALLAFLGVGETHQSGKHRDTVRNAFKALRGVQEASGFVGLRSAANARLANAYAAMALAEFYGMTGSKMGKDPARLAITCVAASQDPSGGWKLAETDSACDPLLTSVCVLALRSGNLAEIGFDEHVFDRAVKWLDATDATTKAAVDARTAAALVTRAFGRWNYEALAKDAVWANDAGVVGARTPEWTEKPAAVDLTTWCTAAPALFQKGGELWPRWWDAFRKSAKARQHTEADACARGSWDAVDPHLPFGGRVATTAMLCRAMESEYVYRRLAARK